MWVLYNGELYHHGIKGMKWGVRRFQKKDGTLTSAGKKRYSDDPKSGAKKPSKHRTRLEQMYVQKGMSQEEAKNAAAKRIKTEKIVATVAGLTLAAASAYVINKKVQERADKIIKAGTTLQRITKNPDEDLSRPFYGAYKNADKTKYAGMMARDHFGGKDVHRVALKAEENIKVASRKKAADAFVDLYKNDPEFREGFKKNNELFKMAFGGIHKEAAGEMTDKQLRKVGYDAFNGGLSNHDSNANAIAKKFYDKLKEQGYDAIVDMNDKKYSGYRAKAPVIIFNSKNKLSVEKVAKMTDEQIASNAKKAYSDLRREIKTKMYIKEGAKQASIITTGSLGVMSINNLRVNDYRAKHPNSGLTDKEILDMLNKK